MLEGSVMSLNLISFQEVIAIVEVRFKKFAILNFLLDIILGSW